MYFKFLTLASIVLARQVEIKPNGVFEFSDIVTKGEIYKFKYSTLSDVEVSLFDSKERKIFSDTNKSATLFAGAMDNGRIKVVVRNKLNTVTLFSYKAPDPNKELLGHIGYVKEVDSVAELTRLLNQLIKDQNAQLIRTEAHQKMVTNSKFWARGLLFFEVIMTAIAVFVIHKDFVSMFEKKQTL
ncbi:hypothetical protein GINT2_001655 [Glugoides intestinalis]